MNNLRISMLSIFIISCFLFPGNLSAQEATPTPHLPLPWPANRNPGVWLLDGFGQVQVVHPPLPEITITLPGGVSLEMVLIPKGSFMMGSPENEMDRSPYESPQRQVNIVYDIYMSKYTVTKAQWQAVMGTTPWAGQYYVLHDPNSPAVYVSWDDAKVFIHALNQLGQGAFRLPSEAEWEYACRAGTTTRFYWGDDLDYTQIGDYAWYGGNTLYRRYAHVVGQKLPNAFGLYDMSGNVYEWCEDDWHRNYHGAPSDGRPWVDWQRGSSRIIRGGYWLINAQYCRSANRNHSGPSNRHDDFGVRLVREAP